MLLVLTMLNYIQSIFGIKENLLSVTNGISHHHLKTHNLYIRVKNLGGLGSAVTNNGVVFCVWFFNWR